MPRGAFKRQLRGAKSEWARLNRKYFGGALDAPELHVVAGWGAQRKIAGDAFGAVYWPEDDTRPCCEHDEEPCVYLLSRLWSDLKALRRVTILHEMIHVAANTGDHRSEAWRNEVARLSQMGALAEVI